MKYYAAIKRNEIMSFTGTSIELEAIILSKLMQEQKTKYHMFSCISGSQAMDMHGDTEWYNEHWRLRKGDVGRGMGDEKLLIGYNVHYLGDRCTKISEFTTI